MLFQFKNVLQIADATLSRAAGLQNALGYPEKFISEKKVN